MDAALKLWSVVAIVGVLNYLSRLSFIAIFARRHVPALLGARVPLRAGRDADGARAADGRRRIPASSVRMPLPKIVAAIVAGVVAFFTHSTLKTLGAGMLVLWALQLAAGAMG